MKIFGVPIRVSRKKPVRKQRARRPASSPWLRQAAKDPSTTKLIDSLAQRNPVIQAAIVRERTGVEINPDDIKVLTPMEAFELAVMNQAVKDLSSDPEAIAMVKDLMVEKVYKDLNQRFGLGGGQPRGRGDNMNNGYGAQPPMDWAAEIDKIERLRQRLGGGSALQTVLNSPVLVTAVKTLIPLLLGGQNNAQAGAASSPEIIDVEVEGKLVPMTREGYEVYKKVAGLLAQKGGIPGGKRSGSSTEGVSPAGTPGPATSPETASPSAPPSADEETGAATPCAPSPAGAMADTHSKPAELSDAVRAGLVLLAKDALADIETKTPKEYAAKVKDQAARGDTLAQTILAFLGSGVTYEDIVNKADPYKQYGDLKPYIEKLGEKKDYVLALIRAVIALDSASGSSA